MISLKGFNTIQFGNKTFSGPNRVTIAGTYLAAKILVGEGAFTHAAYGSSGVATDIEMTTLQGTEYARTPILTKTAEGNVLRLTYEFVTGNNVSVGEFALFDSAVDGLMFARWVIPENVIPVAHTIKGSWEIYVGAFGP